MNGKAYRRRVCRTCYNAQKRREYKTSDGRGYGRERWRKAHGFYKHERRASIVDRIRYIQEVKERTPCADCRLTFHPAAMDFDHVRGDKKAGVAYMAQHGWSLDAIKLEIAKCDIVCANCHRVRTWVTKTSGHLKAA